MPGFEIQPLNTHLQEKTTTSIFLAGGITDCPDWQSCVSKDLIDSDYDFMIYNPRRTLWNVSNEVETQNQISWEYSHFKKVDYLLFWFCEQTDQPITLLEYGLHLKDARPLFVGCHPNYSRYYDVKWQTRLYRSHQRIVTSLSDLVREVLNHTGKIAYLKD